MPRPKRQRTYEPTQAPRLSEPEFQAVLCWFTHQVAIAEKQLAAAREECRLLPNDASEAKAAWWQGALAYARGERVRCESVYHQRQAAGTISQPALTALAVLARN